MEPTSEDVQWHLLNVLVQIEVHENLETAVIYMHTYKKSSNCILRGGAKGERDYFLLQVPGLSIDMI